MIDPQDREAFATALFLAAQCMGRTLDEGVPDAFFDALSELSLDDFRAAARRVVREAEFLTVKALLDAHRRNRREGVKLIGGVPHRWMEGTGWIEVVEGPARGLGEAPRRRSLGPTKPETVGEVMAQWMTKVEPKEGK